MASLIGYKGFVDVRGRRKVRVGFEGLYVRHFGGLGLRDEVRFPDDVVARDWRGGMWDAVW